MTLTCPPRDHLTQFLDNALSSADEESLSRHLETCPHCVSAMEELTGSGATPPDADATRSFRPSSRSALPASELSRLKQFLPPTPTPAPRSEREFPHIPGYDIERELGRGGMGVVYLARQTQLNRRVALKMILAGTHASQDQIIRFLAEAQTCASLHHDNIVQIFETGQHAGTPFFSMEYVEGGNLADRMRNQPPSPHEAAEIVEQLARAMHAAHKKGIIHRDLKPVNVLIRDPLAADADSGATRTFGPGAFSIETKITDFGLAKNFELGSGLTNTGAILGTPDYMAPEQVESGKQRVGPAADIHALGAILYCLIAGRPPFSASTPLETLALVKDADPVSPSQLNRSVPRDLSVICLRCLEKQPDRRYRSAEALADDLNRFRRGQPIAARPVTEFERLWKWARRNPLVATLSASLAAMVLIALGLLSWQLSVASAQRNAEARRADEEAVARAAEAKARHAAQLLSAGYALDQGIQDCRAGRIDVGIESMIRALEILPTDEPDMEYAIRANIGAWREQLCPAIKGPGHGTAVVSVAFNPSGDRVLVGDWGFSLGNEVPSVIQMWDPKHFAEKPIWAVEHPAAFRAPSPAAVGVWSLAFAPDGTRFAGGGLDGTTTVRDAKTGAEVFPSLPHTGSVYAVAFSPDGKTLAVGGSTEPLKIPPVGTGELRFWNAITGHAIGNPIPFPFRINALSWHPDGNALAVGGVDLRSPVHGAEGVAAIFDRKTSAFREPLLTHSDSVGAVAFHPDGKSLLTGCRDGLVRYWTYPGLGQIRASDLQAKVLRHPLPVTSVQFSKNGEMVATASGHHSPGSRAGLGEVHIWDVASATRLFTPHFTPSPGNSQKMHSVSFGDNDRKLAAACEHGNAWLWTLPQPQKPQQEFHYDRRADLQHSPDGRFILHRLMPPPIRGFSEMPSEVHVVEAESGRTIAKFPHEVVVRLRISPDSKRFFAYTVVGSPKPGVWLRELATGQDIPVPAGFGKDLLDLEFSADGHTIHTLLPNGTHREWDAATLAARGEAKPCLTGNEVLLAFDDAGTRVLTRGPEGNRVIALPECTAVPFGRTTPSTQTPDGNPAYYGAFTKDGRLAVTVLAGISDTLVSRHAHDGRIHRETAGKWLLSTRHPDGTRFLLKQSERPVSRFWNAATGELGANEIPVSGIVAIHPHGHLLAATQGNTSGECQLWGLAGKPIGPAIPHGLLNDVRFNPNGLWLVTAGNDKSVKVWKLPVAVNGTPSELRVGR